MEKTNFIKRVFSGIISQSTLLFHKVFSKGKSKIEEKDKKESGSGDKGLEGNAKKFRSQFPTDCYIPTDIRIYNTYIERRAEFDQRFGLLLRKGFIRFEDYSIRRHYYSLDAFGNPQLLNFY